MKKYKSVRNGQIAELISENEQQVVIKLESGEEKALSHATLNRWWKLMEDEEMQEQPQSEVVEEATQEEATEAVEEPAEETEEVVEEEQPIQEESAPEEPKQEETKSEKKAKTEKTPKQKRETVSGDHPLKFFIEQLAIERQTEVFVATVPSFRSLKVDGRMYMAFTFNKKGVTLWMRSKAVGELTEYKKVNHMFDARVHFGEDTLESRKEIEKLLDASLEFQKNHRAKKTK